MIKSTTHWSKERFTARTERIPPAAFVPRTPPSRTRGSTSTVPWWSPAVSSSAGGTHRSDASPAVTLTQPNGTQLWSRSQLWCNDSNAYDTVQVESTSPYYHNTFLYILVLRIPLLDSSNILQNNSANPALRVWRKFSQNKWEMLSIYIKIPLSQV